MYNIAEKNVVFGYFGTVTIRTRDGDDVTLPCIKYIETIAPFKKYGFIVTKSEIIIIIADSTKFTHSTEGVVELLTEDSIITARDIHAVHGSELFELDIGFTWIAGCLYEKRRKGWEPSHWPAVRATETIIPPFSFCVVVDCVDGSVKRFCVVEGANGEMPKAYCLVGPRA
jgi:hypothetical protein